MKPALLRNLTTTKNVSASQISHPRGVAAEEDMATERGDRLQSQCRPAVINAQVQVEIVERGRIVRVDGVYGGKVLKTGNMVFGRVREDYSGWQQ